MLGYARPVLESSGDPRSGGGPCTRLIVAIDRAAHAGWAQTARLTVLIAVAAGAIALVILAGR